MTLTGGEGGTEETLVLVSLYFSKKFGRGWGLKHPPAMLAPPCLLLILQYSVKSIRKLCRISTRSHTAKTGLYSHVHVYYAVYYV